MNPNILKQKNTSIFGFWLRTFFAAATLAICSPTQAATLTWDSNATFADGVTEGSGTWNTTLTDWRSTASDVAWPNGGANIAVFTGTGAGPFTVTLGTTITMTINGGITFDVGPAYTLTSGTLTMGNATAGSNNTIQTLSTVTNSQTVNSPISVTGNDARLTLLSNAASSANTLNFGGQIGGASGSTGHPNHLTLDGSNSGNNTISGNIVNVGVGAATAAIDLTKQGTGKWVLTGSNTYGNGTNVNAGTLTLGSTTAITAGAITINGGTLDTQTFGNTTAGALTLNSGAFIGTTGVFSGGSYVVRSGTVSAILGGGAKTLTKQNTTTVTLSGANTYTGATSVNSGTLLLDYSAAGAPANGIINNAANSSALTLSAGTLAITGSAGGTHTQTFNGTTFGIGGSFFTVNQNGAASVSGSLGAITRNSGATVRFDLPTTGTIVTTSTAAATSLSSGNLLANSANTAYATVSGADWATNVSGTIGRFTSYSVNDFSATANNVDITTNGSPAAFTVSTLRFNTAASTLTLAGTNILNAGGILVSSTGAGSSIGGSGLLRAASNQEIVLIDNGTFTLGAKIADSASGASVLTLSGTGTTTLSATNTFTGGTIIANGTVKVGNALALGATSGSVNVTKGTLDLNGNSVAINALNGAGNTGGTAAVGFIDNTSASPVTLTLGANGGGGTFQGVIQNSVAALSLLKVGAGTQTIRDFNVGNSYTGTTTISGGTLQVDANGTGAGTTINMLPSTNQLILAGGVFGMTSQTNTADNQTFAGLTVNAGDSSTAFAGRQSGASYLMAFNGITRNTPGGTVNLSGTATSTSVTTTTANVNGIIGGYAVVGNEWATGTVAIAALATYQTGADASLWASGSNIKLTTTSATNAGIQTVNSLNFQGTADSLTQNAATTLTIASGGILASQSGLATISGGNLTSGNGTGGNDLIFINKGGLLDVQSAIVDTTAGMSLTKSGGGWVQLSASNSFTGAVYINQSVLQIGNVNALNITHAVNFGTATNVAGVLALNGFNTTVASISSANVTAGVTSVIENANGSSVSNSTLTVGGTNSTTFSGLIQNGSGGGTLALTKSGSNSILTLSGVNTYTGNTTITGGTLALLTSTTNNNISSSPKIIVGDSILNNTAGLDVTGVTSGFHVPIGQTLAGHGIITGSVTMDSGSILSPGNTVGTLSIGSLTMSTGSIYNFEFADSGGSPLNNDQVTVTNSGGLTVNGGIFNIYANNTVNTYLTTGTFTLLGYTGADTVGGSLNSILSVGNPQAGLTYTFSDTGSAIKLAITGTAALIANWVPDGNGSWASLGSWTPGIPNALGATANFGATATNVNLARTASLNGDKSVATINFSSPNGESYTVDQGSSGNLILTNGTNTATVTVLSGTHTISAPVLMSSNAAVAITNAADKLTVSGTINETTPSSITKTGNGTLVLSSLTNAYSGGTTLSAGTIQISGSGSLGTGGLTFASAAGTRTLKWASGNIDDISGVAVTLNADGIFDTNGNDVTFANPVGNSGAGGLAKSGSGTLTLANANTYTGATTLKGGVLNISNDSALGAVPGSATNNIVFDPGAGKNATLQSNLTITTATNRNILLSTGTATFDTFGVNITVNGALSGGGALKKIGVGTMSLMGASTATGSVVVDDGNLFANVFANLPSGSITLNGTSELSIRVPASSTTTVSLAVTGTNILNGSNTGILALSTLTGGSNTQLTVNGGFVNDFTGNLTGFSGTLTLGSNINYRFNGTGGSSNATFDLGTGTASLTVRNTANAIPLGALQGGANTTLSGNGGGSTATVTYTIGANNRSTTFDGSITNGGNPISIVKTGTGSLTLTHALAYTGTTTVNGGVLNLNNTIASPTITVAAGATLNANVAATGTGSALIVNGTANFAGPDSTLHTAGSLSISTTGSATITQHTIPGVGSDPEGSAFVKVLDTKALNIAGAGVLDMTNNAMIVRGGTDAVINALVTSGFNSFSNNGPGINSSTAAGGAPATVGELDNSILNLSTWEGISGLDTDPNGAYNQILVKYTWYGDANLDGTVTPDDYLLTDAGASGSGTGWLFGDFNYDGTVSPDDYLLIDAGSSSQDGSQFTGGSGGKGDGLAGGAAAVPEPGSIGLLLVGIISLLALRCQKQKPA